MSNDSVITPALTPGVHEFPVDGVRQAYRVAGRGPVCVAHSGGPGLDAAYLRSPELEEHFTVVYPDPVGTGRSGRLDDPPGEGAGYTRATYVRHLAAVVEHLGLPRVHLLGHSYGGFVVQDYALEHPERVAGLILYSTAAEAGPAFWGAAMEGLAAYPQRHPDVPEAARVPAAFQQALGAGDDESISRLFAEALPVYFADFWSRQPEFAAFRASIRMAQVPATAPEPVEFDVRDRLGALGGTGMPVVVVTGQHDFIGGPRWAQALGQAIPGARLRILQHSGHFGHVEEPGGFARAAALVLGG
ncbi:alpha/beta hydrolase [Kineosporia sp. J2-2]|uniref:Alpha/beta hydrolase n=1 Tax=Kineosporia corallincola TaxID=2835133 RepID=A0ABS5TQ69_9ACTN|nr:alpha/beta hydrolase [Kineosporia corallincola]MBT0773252.1 alpha/beta hydrolase [Kineosporia corallincola]